MKREIYRPMRIVHGNFGYQPGDPYEKKEKCVYDRIKELKDKGMGGIVTNVGSPDYLKDEDEWKLMRRKAEICQELGMRMWLYDEDAYPSGVAGTATLDKNPDFECRGLVMVSHVLAPGETYEQQLPHGHEKLVAAVCYQMAGSVPKDEELLTPYRRLNGESVFFENDTQTNLLCLVFYEKYLYEGTHAQNNVAFHRRYVDVSNPEAIAEFINNTYRPYTKVLGDFYARRIGDEEENAVIEAIFTDEPSYMGVYINHGIECPETVHPVDETIKLYPVVNWGKNTANRFASRYGYCLEDELTALFLGHGEHFCQVRHDFYQLMSDLYEQAFFAQLSDYCAQVGLNFSGHILLEDELSLHVLFEGNFFKLLRHMHIPGIDMLQSKPEIVWDFAFTPRLVRGIAELYGREHVLDEASAHAQGGKVTAEEMYVSLMLQLAFGADVFTFYYSDEDPDGSKHKIYDALNRAGEAIDGNRLSDTLLFYPIETMMRRRKPLYHGIENIHEEKIAEADDNGKEYVFACQDALMEAQYAMLNAQHSFTYIDTETAAHQQNGKWKNLVVTACDVTEEMTAVFAKLQKNGTQLIWYAQEGSTLFAEGFEKMPAGCKIAQNAEKLLALVRPQGAELEGADTEGIAFTQTDACALLVNRDTREKQLCWKGGFVSLTDAMSGEGVEAVRSDEGVSFMLPGSAALILQKK